MPEALRAAMTRATIDNCAERFVLVVVGNLVTVAAGSTPPRICCPVKERLTTSAYVASNRFARFPPASVRCAVARVLITLWQAEEPNNGETMLWIGIAPPVGEIEYVPELSPVRNRLSPAGEMHVNRELPLPAANKSAILPPQPEVLPTGPSA